MSSGPQGEKRRRDVLRRELLGQGRSVDEIATAMRALFRDRARQSYRHALGLTQQQLADRYNEIVGDARAPMTKQRISDYELWPGSQRRPTFHTLGILARILGTSRRNLVDVGEYDQLPLAERELLDETAGRSPPTGPPTFPRRGEPGRPVPDPTDSGTSLGQLEHWLDSLLHAYPTTPAEPLLSEARRLCVAVHRLLGTEARDRDATRLHRLGCRAGVLLSQLSQQLGRKGYARLRAQVAWLHAELADDDGLRALALGAESLAVLWAGRSGEAARLARAGYRYVGSGPVLARLAALEARAAGRMGDLGAMDRALARAEHARNASVPATVTTVPFSEGLHCYYLGDACSWSPDRAHAERGEQLLRRSLSLHHAREAADMSFADAALVRVSLAVVSLHQGRLEETLDTTRTVLDTPAEHRLPDLGQSLLRLRDLANAGPYRGSVAVAEVRTLVERFLGGSDPGADGDRL